MMLYFSVERLPLTCSPELSLRLASYNFLSTLTTTFRFDIGDAVMEAQVTLCVYVWVDFTNKCCWLYSHYSLFWSS